VVVAADGAAALAVAVAAPQVERVLGPKASGQHRVLKVCVAIPAVVC
jgi:hypothetical protein